MKIGILKEHKTPGDQRVVLTPELAKSVDSLDGVEVVVQRYSDRCYSDEEYSDAGLALVDDVDDCDVLLGVKEVPIPYLVDGKTMMFFSHTIKKQSYNRRMLQAILNKKIRLIDYEVVTDEQGQRLIAFGHYAGLVGAYNGIMAYGSRTGAFSLNRMHSYAHYAEAIEDVRMEDWPDMRIVLTGKGRVGNGAATCLRDLGLREVSVEDFLGDNVGSGAVFVQLDSEDYCRHIDGVPFDRTEFFTHPERFTLDFVPYYSRADIMINGIYWDSRAPVFFTIDEMRRSDFAIKVIADITCDIAPHGSIPSTIRPSTIAEPVYGFDPQSGEEIDAYNEKGIDVMAIDNLPNELPRDASEAFGTMFIDYLLPELLVPQSDLMDRASITTHEGRLGQHFQYLDGYVAAS